MAAPWQNRNGNGTRNASDGGLFVHAKPPMSNILRRPQRDLLGDPRHGHDLSHHVLVQQENESEIVGGAAGSRRSTYSNVNETETTMLPSTGSQQPSGHLLTPPRAGMIIVGGGGSRGLRTSDALTIENYDNSTHDSPFSNTSQLYRDQPSNSTSDRRTGHGQHSGSSGKIPEHLQENSIHAPGSLAVADSAFGGASSGGETLVEDDSKRSYDNTPSFILHQPSPVHKALYDNLHPVPPHNDNVSSDSVFSSSRRADHDPAHLSMGSELSGRTPSVQPSLSTPFARQIKSLASKYAPADAASAAAPPEPPPATLSHPHSPHSHLLTSASLKNIDISWPVPVSTTSKPNTPRHMTNQTHSSNLTPEGQFIRRAPPPHNTDVLINHSDSTPALSSVSNRGLFYREPSTGDRAVAAGVIASNLTNKHSSLGQGPPGLSSFASAGYVPAAPIERNAFDFQPASDRQLLQRRKLSSNFDEESSTANSFYTNAHRISRTPQPQSTNRGTPPVVTASFPTGGRRLGPHFASVSSSSTPQPYITSPHSPKPHTLSHNPRTPVPLTYSPFPVSSGHSHHDRARLLSAPRTPRSVPVSHTASLYSNPWTRAPTPPPPSSVAASEIPSTASSQPPTRTPHRHQQSLHSGIKQLHQQPYNGHLSTSPKAAALIPSYAPGSPPYLKTTNLTVYVDPNPPRQPHATTPSNQRNRKRSRENISNGRGNSTSSAANLRRLERTLSIYDL